MELKNYYFVIYIKIIGQKTVGLQDIYVVLNYYLQIISYL